MSRKLVSFILLALVCVLAGPQLQAQESVTVVNAASFEIGLPLSPGCWATAFADFASVGVVNTGANALPFPTMLGGVQVFVNNVASPMNFVGGTQINFLIPAGTPDQGRVPFRVVVAGATTFEGTLNMWPISPGLLSITTDPTRPGRVLNQDDTENSAQNPAGRGEIVQIYGVGADFSALPEDGSAASKTTLFETLTTPKGYISVFEAAVQFSGLAPGLVNAWQLNLVVPDNSIVKGQVPVSAKIGGLSTNIVSIWVAE